jgi:dipeptidyl aminopeptidase/acylaminoacyl peptidase
MSNAGIGTSQFAVSESGAFIYLQGKSTGAVSIDWLGQDGTTQALRAPLAAYRDLRFSPDGRRIAFQLADQQSDLWVYEWERESMTRLTIDPDQDSDPVWAPDGRHIAFASTRGDKATFNLYWMRADGPGEPQRLTESKTNQFPYSWDPKGKLLAFEESGDIMILPMEGNDASGWKPGKPWALSKTPYTEQNPAFSPDGQWLAYISNETGDSNVYVQPFPGPGERSQISPGALPVWSRNESRLFFENENRLFVANYKIAGGSFHADKPQLWSSGMTAFLGFARDFDLHPDGRRVAILKAPEVQTHTLDKVTFIFNFSDELHRIAPRH